MQKLANIEFFESLSNHSGSPTSQMNVFNYSGDYSITGFGGGDYTISTGWDGQSIGTTPSGNQYEYTPNPIPMGNPTTQDQPQYQQQSQPQTPPNQNTDEPIDDESERKIYELLMRIPRPNPNGKSYPWNELDKFVPKGTSFGRGLWGRIKHLPTAVGVKLGNYLGAAAGGIPTWLAAYAITGDPNVASIAGAVGSIPTQLIAKHFLAPAAYRVQTEGYIPRLPLLDRAKLWLSTFGTKLGNTFSFRNPFPNNGVATVPQGVTAVIDAYQRSTGRYPTPEEVINLFLHE